MLVAIIIVGLTLLFSPWLIRNASVPSGSGLALGTIHHGMYPNFMFNEDVRSKGFPYRFDPNSGKIGSSWRSLGEEIGKRFSEEPLEHLKWYVVNKPRALFSWDMIQGMGDVFVYPVHESPYFHDRRFIYTHKAMRMMHWPLMMAAFLCIFVSVFRPHYLRLSRLGLFVCRLMGSIVLYHVAIHMVGAPFPRYGIPLRPEMYGLALIFIYALSTFVMDKYNHIKLNFTSNGSEN